MVFGSPGEASTRRTHRLASGSRRGELDGCNDHAKRLAAARIRAPGEDPCVLIIGDSTNPASQRHFASQTPGAVTVEAVDLRVWSRSRGGSISRLRTRLISLRRSLRASWPMWVQRISWLVTARYVLPREGVG